MNTKFIRNFLAENVKEILERQWSRKNEMETVKASTYIGDMVSAGGGCEAAVIARARCRWVKFRECGAVRQIFSKAKRNCL